MKPAVEVAESSSQRILESAHWHRSMATPISQEPRPTFVVCLDDGGHPLSLQPRTIYR